MKLYFFLDMFNTHIYTNINIFVGFFHIRKPVWQNIKNDVIMLKLFHKSADFSLHYV